MTEKESTKIRKTIAEIAKERKQLIKNIDEIKKLIKTCEDKINKTLLEKLIVGSMDITLIHHRRYLLCRKEQRDINLFNEWLKDKISKLKKQTKLLKRNRELLKKALIMESSYQENKNKYVKIGDVFKIHNDSEGYFSVKVTRIINNEFIELESMYNTVYIYDVNNKRLFNQNHDDYLSL